MSDERPDNAGGDHPLFDPDALEPGVDTRLFSPQSFDAFKESVDAYSSELVHEATRIMRRKRSDSISVDDVKTASANLAPGGATKLAKSIGTIGGLLAGGAVGNLLSLASSEKITALSAILTALLLGVGTAMIAYQFARE